MIGQLDYNMSKHIDKDCNDDLKLICEDRRQPTIRIKFPKNRKYGSIMVDFKITITETYNCSNKSAMKELNKRYSNTMMS